MPVATINLNTPERLLALQALYEAGMNVIGDGEREDEVDDALKRILDNLEKDIKRFAGGVITDASCLQGAVTELNNEIRNLVEHPTREFRIEVEVNQVRDMLGGHPVVAAAVYEKVR